MSSYVTYPNETFESVSRKVYGTEQKASLIRESNPGKTEPFPENTRLFIPDDPDGIKSNAKQSAGDINEIILFINGKRFRFWTSIKITRSIDSFSTITVGANFESDNQIFRDAFKPLKYLPIEVNIGDEPLFTGTTVNVDPAFSNDGSTVSIQGYSKPGVFGDCTAPSSMKPLEFEKQNLQQIAQAIASPFGIGVEFTSDAGAAFDQRVALDPSGKVLSFLKKLAQQKKLIISNTASGKLLFQQSIKTGIHVASFSQGDYPLVSVSANFKAQEYYSDLTGVTPSFLFFAGTDYSTKNTKLQSVLRPLTFKVDDSDSGTLKDAVEAKMGRMFANVVSYQVTISEWRDSSNNLWEPNTLVNLFCPDAMVYTDTTFIIRSVELNKIGNSETAVLTLVLPGSFSGEIPEVLPWD